jgi:hypothetical protein
LKNSTNQSGGIQSEQQKVHLNHILRQKLGIRTISAFIETWINIKNKDEAGQKSFFNSLGFLNEKSNPDNLFYLFENISKQGELMVTEYNSFYEEFQGGYDNSSADTA